MVNICGPEFGTFFSNSLLPLVGYASIATGIIIGLTYMIGNLLSNPKITLWSKTEVLQLGISLCSIFILVATVNTFCVINMGEIVSIFGLQGVTPQVAGGLQSNVNLGTVNIYSAAQNYLNESAIYSHNALTVVRYQLQAYTVLSYFNAFICDFSFPSTRSFPALDAIFTCTGIAFYCTNTIVPDHLSPITKYILPHGQCVA
ncbi:hypothetical protein HZC07_02710 [Candidatus Micrarchaeota archaeon]|nr:hypothetical protein [Candidatus Micrarchaeota archaeon]